jgi:hypothetical protein
LDQLREEILKGPILSKLPGYSRAKAKHEIGSLAQEHFQYLQHCAEQTAAKLLSMEGPEPFDYNNSETAAKMKAIGEQLKAAMNDSADEMRSPRG